MCSFWYQLSEAGRGTPQLYEYATTALPDSRLKLVDTFDRTLNSASDPYAFFNASKIYLDNQFVGTNPIPTDIRHNEILQVSGKDKPLLMPTGNGEIELLEFYAVTRLNDGRLFISGGAEDKNRAPKFSKEDFLKYLKNTWLFDPKTKKISQGPNLLHPRVNHKSTLLKDGRVLIAGGGKTTSERTLLRDCEIYDPKNNTIQSIGLLNKPRQYHSALLLKNGKVLFTGGSTDVGFSDSDGHLTSTIEVFDPITTKFTLVGQMHFARQRHYALPIGESGAIILGGETDMYRDNPSDESILIAEFFDGTRVENAKKVIHAPNLGGFFNGGEIKVNCKGGRISEPRRPFLYSPASVCFARKTFKSFPVFPSNLA